MINVGLPFVSITSNIENTLLFSWFILMLTELTAEAFSRLCTDLGVEGLTQDAFSPNADTDPDKWRGVIQEAPRNLLEVHKIVWENNSHLLKDVIALDPKYVADKLAELICPSGKDTLVSFPVGLIEAEGCFSVYPVGSTIKIMEEFTLALHPVDDQIIRSLRAFFGVGVVKRKRDKSIFTVDSSWQLHYVIIPFIEQHSLIGLKRRDFLILKEIVYIKTQTGWLRSPKTRNLTKYWIVRIVYMLAEVTETRERTRSLEDIRSILNVKDTGLPVEFFSYVIVWWFLCSLTQYVKPSPLYVTGFCEGDGGSTVSVLPNKIVHTYNIGASQEGIIEMLKAYFGCGRIYKVNLSNQGATKDH